MFNENPTIIQQAPTTNCRNEPLFLLHDGSGSILKYFKIKSLDRAVYGIHDPKFLTNDIWDGGIREMAHAYIDLIKSVHPQGPLFIGG